MAWLRRLRTETAVKDGVRRWRCARLRVGTHGEERRREHHGWLDDDTDKDRDECRNLRCRVIGVLGIGLAMAHAKRLLTIGVRSVLVGHAGHIGTAPHLFHPRHRFLLRCVLGRPRACRTGIGSRCQLN